MGNKKVSLNNIAAKVIATYLERVDDNSTKSMFTHVTEQPHNFFAGSQVTISNMSTSASAVTTAAISSTVSGSPVVNQVTFYSVSSFYVGQKVTISGIVSTAYNGNFTVISKESDRFTVYNTSTAAISDGVGTATAIIDPNIVNGIVHKVNSPTEFSVMPLGTTAYEANKVLTGPGTAQLINGHLSSLDIIYAAPEYNSL
jgi:hypothetical protein